MNTASVEVVHAVPGRVRFRIPRLKSDPAVCAVLVRDLSGIEGIEDVQVNPVTGTVLLLFDPERLQSGDSLATLGRVMLSALPDVDLSSLDLHAMWTRMNGNGAGQDEKSGAASPGSHSSESFWPSWTSGWAVDDEQGNLLRLLPWVLGGLGVRELLLGRSSAMPTWYDYFWFAFASYHIVNGPQMQTTRGDHSQRS